MVSAIWPAKEDLEIFWRVCSDKSASPDRSAFCARDVVEANPVVRRDWHFVFSLKVVPHEKDPAHSIPNSVTQLKSLAGNPEKIERYKETQSRRIGEP